MGCKGPEANYNCPTVRFNNATSWPVKAGHGCIACASPRFWDTKSPFYERLPQPPGFGVDVTVGEIGWTVVELWPSPLRLTESANLLAIGELREKKKTRMRPAKRIPAWRKNKWRAW
jgi:Ni,Fe-hydrogenase I small subunit